MAKKLVCVLVLLVAVALLGSATATSAIEKITGKMPLHMGQFAQESLSSSAMNCMTVTCHGLGSSCNQSCSSGDCQQCVYDTGYCNSSSICTPNKAYGDICTSSSECPPVKYSLFTENECVYNYTSGNSRCTKTVYLGDINDDCSSNSDCRSGLDCTGGVCVGKAEGAECASNSECGSNLYCSNSTCEKRLQIGSNCSSTELCDMHLSCHETCYKQYSKKNGESCVYNDNCISGYFCNSTTSTCQATSPIRECNGTAGQCNDGETCTCQGFTGKSYCTTPEMPSEAISAAISLANCVIEHGCGTIGFSDSSCAIKNCDVLVECWYIEALKYMGLPISCVDENLSCKNPGNSASGLMPHFAMTLFGAIALAFALAM